MGGEPLSEGSHQGCGQRGLSVRFGSNDSGTPRSLMMLPILSALLAFIAALFRSRTSLCLEHLALRHQ